MFEWIDDTPADFYPWNHNQPDNWANAEDCVELYSQNDARWNDVRCEYSRPFICR